jgi:hypothetical protein
MRLPNSRSHCGKTKGERRHRLRPVLPSQKGPRPGPKAIIQRVPVRCAQGCYPTPPRARPRPRKGLTSREATTAIPLPHVYRLAGLASITGTERPDMLPDTVERPSWAEADLRRITSFCETSPPKHKDDSSGFAKTEKLKALVLNRPFNHVARKLVWRLLVGRDGAHRAPWLELTRQLRTG